MSLTYLAQASDHQQLEWIGGSVMTVLLDADATGGQLTMIRTQLKRGDASPLHMHSNEDEMFMLLKGSGTFWVGEDRHEVDEGGVVFLPRNLPHAYRITSDTVDLLTMCTPGGVEKFFRAAGHDLRNPKPDDWALTPATMARAAAVGGQTILGPPRTDA